MELDPGAAHRGGLGTRARLDPDASLFPRIGGRAAVGRIIVALADVDVVVDLSQAAAGHVLRVQWLAAEPLFEEPRLVLALLRQVACELRAKPLIGVDEIVAS